MSRPLLLAALAALACNPGKGGDDTDTDTGAPVDSEVHSDVPVTGTVSVYVESAPSTPAQGVTVVFHTPDGAVLTTATTDASGRASTEITGSAGITVVLPSELRTVLGVVPGDEVRLVSHVSSIATMDPTTHVEVAAHPGADNYRLGAGCGTKASSTVASGFDVATGDRCRFGAGRVDVFAVASAGSTPMAYTYSLDVPASGTVTLPTPWRTDWSTRTVAVESAPASLQQIVAGVNFRRRGLVMHTAAGASPVDDAGAAAVLVLAPRGLAEETELRMVLTYQPPGGPTGVAQTFDIVDGDVPASRLFTGADLPVPAQAITIDDADVARPRFSWSGSSVEGGTMVGFGASGSGGTVAWFLLSEGATTSLQVPALPDELATLRPTSAPESYLVTTMTVDGLTPHELVRDWNVMFREGDFTAYDGDARSGRLTQVLVSP